MPPTLHLSLVVVAVFSAFVSFHLFGVVNPRVDAPVESGAPSSFFEDARLPYSSLLEDAQLLDIVLVASVDGKFHALNRSTGHTLWSSLTSSGGSITLPPLVRTSHLDHDPDLTDYQETYIIEPQSGDIYVMATPSSPIERFPFTMAEIVEMSPFSFTADDDHRVFVGNKETSWLVVELETPTGVKAPVEGPWDPFEDLHIGEEKIDLDELDGSKPQMSKLEVLIGRTGISTSEEKPESKTFVVDYHVTIHSGASNKMQTLSFSTYGPNILYSVLQGSYRRTKDEKYIQSLPNGEIISFKVHGESAQSSASNILWAYKFSNPMCVLIFSFIPFSNCCCPQSV
ncbi:hypothetical protein B0H11DRAFT_196560 [Mycena galericulata]|nr:hypothetical protein B0H11DRAFT_196560 [Mycena galericulata]